MLDFKRVYVDSEPLLAAPWPKFSKPLETALRLCQQFSVEVVLPAPVLEQLEAHWQRDLREALNTAAGSRSRVGRFFARVGLNIPPDQLPSLEEALSKYRAAVVEVLSAWSISQAPTTGRPTVELFAMAVGLRPPFEAEGKNFQDAVILLSAVDHLLANPADALFLSADGDFRDVRFDEYLGEGKPRMRLCASVGDLEKRLEQALDAVVRALWNADRLVARKALENELPRLQEFILENLRIEPTPLGIFGPLAAIPSAAIRQVQRVETPFPAIRKEGDAVTVTALVEIDLKVLKRDWSGPSPKPLKIGEPLRDEPLADFDLSRLLPRFVEDTVPLVVEVEAVATFTDGHYSNLQFSNVRPRGDAISMSSIFGVFDASDTKVKGMVELVDAQNTTPGSITTKGG